MLWILLAACSCSGNPQLDAAVAENEALSAENERLTEENEDLQRKLELLEAELARLQLLLAELDPTMEPPPEGEEAAEQPEVLEEVDRSPDARTPRPSGQHCVSTGSGRYRLSEPIQANDITAVVRIKPWMDDDGVLDGLRLSGISPGSLPATCGFQSGDIVHEIDGVTVTSLDQALDMFAELQHATSSDFLVTRKGRTISWTVDGPG